MVTGLENPLGMDPAVHAVLPNLAAARRYSDDGRELTLYLQPDPRWSDGHPFSAVRGESLSEPAGTPTVNAFFLARKSPTLQVYERNPYYPKVDPAGQQLPYVDRVRSLVAMNPAPPSG